MSINLRELVEKRAARVNEAVPASGSIVVLEPGKPAKFKGSLRDEDGVEQTGIPSTLHVGEKILLVEAGLHRQWVGGFEKKDDPQAREQFVLTLAGYLPGARLSFTHEDEEVDVTTLFERVESQMISWAGQKFSCNEEAAMEFGKLLEKDYGMTAPESMTPQEPNAKTTRVWNLAVTVPNETALKRPAIIQQRILRAQEHGPFLSRLEVGENWNTEKEQGFKNFLYNFMESADLAERMDADEDEARKKAAGILLSSITGRREGAPVTKDGETRVPVYPERADVGRLSVAGVDFDFWTTNA